jgi:hypothetical protein
MLDPGLLPRAEARGATVEVTVTHGDGSSYRLRRVAAPIPEDAPPVPLPVDDRQRYRWILETGEGRVDSCVDASVYAYLAYLRQVQVDRLVDPAADDYGFTGSGVVMTDDEGLRHVIEVGRQTEEAFVRNVSAGLTSVLPVSRASWLTPSASVLLDSLPQPSPFDTARR